MYTRNDTRKINIGNVSIGGGSPIAVQSMTNTDTRDVHATVNQILRLEEAGCDIIRVAVPDEAAANAVKEIKKNIHVPLVADIHFNYKLALMCIENGIDKVRINPGNIGSSERTHAVTEMCSKYNIPIRIGINGGSLEKDILAKYGSPTPEAIVESAMGHINILESMGFYDIAVSLKSSNVPATIESYRLMAEKRNYPLHIGITESGTLQNGTIKSSVGIGAILAMGIGDTIRVSLTGDPVEEVRVGRKILHSLELGGNRMIQFVSCPTCGRTRVDLIGTANLIEQKLSDLEAQGVFKNPLTVSVMGCAVNGPGEAKHSDIGLAGGENEFLMFIKGEIIGKFSPENAIEKFIEKVVEMGS
ncbi:MAG: flavodoxin-dependent (E)-4-hydroxy-3-methylbut-2-enyl-diphosphate synthase [Clostridia bacterium]|nr:flavodoxin-dependent (E)-4-hydroxy-3-methylbut-2-enyl-diphosphate synthase [Clostridia bacterium]